MTKENKERGWEGEFYRQFVKQGIPIGILKYENKDGTDITASKMIEYIRSIEDAKEKEVMGLLPKVYCELCGVSDYFIEKPHPDSNGKGQFADMVCKKCGLIIATFHSQFTKLANEKE